MKVFRFVSLLILAALFFSCDTTKKVSAGSGGDDGIIEVVFLQMNDVYEISPSPSDNRGGLARVATLRKELLAKNPNTFTVLAGDFISPSVTGTLKYENKRIRGRHMVETLNTLGLNMVVFGNHEFDYDDLTDLQARLDESTFTWLTGNVRLKPPVANQSASSFMQQFFKNKPGGGTEICPDNQVLTFKDADGTTLNLGIFGVLVDNGKKPWAVYSDWVQSAQKSISELTPKTDVIVGLTHLNVVDDKKLAGMFPQIPLIMGGHDHDNMMHKVGPSVVAKADANAKTVYVHTLRYDKKLKKCTVKSELKQINEKIADEPATAAIVAKWEKIKVDALVAAGINPNNVVASLEQPLDCRESVVRHQQTRIGQMVNEAMMVFSRNKPDGVILNSGSIRVDDILTGKLTELDIVRILPFGGAMNEIEIKGSLLKKTLDAGASNKGNGGYLQLHNIRRDDTAGKWLVAGNVLNDNQLYKISLPEFLLTGNETNMAFLKANLDANGKSTNPDIPTIIKPDSKDKNDKRNDIRLMLIRYLIGE
ncbi:MAG: bifunctional metallophosphatase/5'-nucleotidase [Saprospiraceae bacterium]|nr:bifunctional metallophosphatase/5'-nucleotidase [Saprospiraceae bacterium]